MKKYLLIIIFTISSFIILQSHTLAQKLTTTLPMSRPADFENYSAPDSAGNRFLLKTPSLNKAQSALILPYPIIFIHGINSYSETWNTMTDFMDSQYNTTFGGRYDFCLNYDKNNSVANLKYWSDTGADNAFFSGTWVAGDYYYVNFDIGSNGSFHPNGSSYDVKSNQQAIAKQGLALREVIYRVLQLTGRSKVVLIGHSMGGLAAREYLENQNLWQPDGQHHVAKLVTTGTPHGGSNAYAPDFITGIDTKSDAVRDLKRSYLYSSDPGVYLFGGNETNSVMDDFFSGYFYNVDVNCNGTKGEHITGLDEKDLYNNLDYSCIIGKCTSCPFGQELPGDGIVKESSANLTKYYSGLKADIFYYSGTAYFEIHTDLPSQKVQNMQGLDEPYSISLAYEIGFDQTYTGFMTVQASNNPYSPVDYDDYKFSVPEKSNVDVSISNINSSDFKADIFDANGNKVGSTIHSNGSASFSFTKILDAGNYFLEIYSTPNSSSYLYPYKFILSRTTFADYSISGTVKYDNAPGTVMKNTTVYLKTAEGAKLDSTLTDNGGAYKFLHKAGGTYMLDCRSSAKWSGGNPLDALLVNRYFIKTYSFSNPLREKAADVNSDSSINSADALLINRRYINEVTTFRSGDWVFENPTFTITGTDIIKDIKGICSGDVNGSHIP